MKKSMKFVRGQVWHWSDPVYGAKSNVFVPPGESSMRYSRYVLLIQNSDTITNSVLVIPLSSKSRGPIDIEVDLCHRTTRTTSYIKVSKIMPVSLPSLDEYICTLSDDTMETIDALLMYYINPNNFNSATDPVNQQLVTALTESEETEEIDDISAFMLNENKKRYDSTIVIPEGKITIPVLKKSTPTGGKKTKTGSNINSFSLEEKKEFVAFKDAHTIKQTASEYGISGSSVSRYYTRFKEALQVSEKSEEVVEDLEEPAAEEIPDDTVSTEFEEEEVEKELSDEDKCRNIISGISNYILKDLRLQHTYDYYTKNRTGKDFMTDYQFYTQLSASLYYSLLDYYKIKEDYNTKELKFDGSDFLSSSEYFILSNMYDQMKDGTTPYQLKSYLNKTKEGINSDWLTQLKGQMGRRFSMKSNGINAIIDLVKNTYCI